MTLNFWSLWWELMLGFGYCWGASCILHSASWTVRSVAGWACVICCVSPLMWTPLRTALCLSVLCPGDSYPPVKWVHTGENQVWLQIVVTLGRPYRLFLTNYSHVIVFLLLFVSWTKIQKSVVPLILMKIRFTFERLVWNFQSCFMIP